MIGYILGFDIGAFGVSLSSRMWRKNYWATGVRFFDTEQWYHIQRWNLK
jgi:hypothetical protein